MICSVAKAYRFCTEVIEALQKLPSPHADFVNCSIPRINSVRNELWPLKEVVERHTAIIYSVASGIQARLDSDKLEDELLEEEACG